MTAGVRYDFQQVLGTGGFGTVYRAERVDSHGVRRLVAVKVLNPGASEAFEPRLRDEARILGLLRHRSIVSVDGIERVDGRVAVVMEYVPGQSLAALVRDGPLPSRVAVEVVRDVALGLEHAHTATDSAGEPLHLVHRDVKPSNVQLTPAGAVKLLDFGVARAWFDEREAHTRATRFDSQGYTAPERFDGVDEPASDVFSLGVVLFECLTGERLGQPPVRPAPFREMLLRVEEALAAQPDALRDLTLDMLCYEPAGRPSAAEVAARLQEVFTNVDGPWLAEYAREHVVPGGQEIDGPLPVSAPTLYSPTTPRARWPWLAAAAAVVAAGAGARALRGSRDAPPALVPRSELGCQVFPDDSPFNTPVADMPLLRRSDAMIETIGLDAEVVPMFGRLHGVPYTVVPAFQPPYPVMFGWPDESDPGPYPIPRDVRVDDPETRHAIVIQRGNPCVLYELIGLDRAESGWRADAGAIWRMDSNALRPDGWTSADGAGLPMFPLLATYDEVAAGRITHALRVSVAIVAQAFVHPATHSLFIAADGIAVPQDAPPMGQRLRLRADYDCDTLGEQASVVCRAMQEFGMFVADGGTTLFLGGAPDPRWDERDLGTLRRITARDLEAVDSGPAIPHEWLPAN